MPLPPARVVATAGMSPAVLTELGWWSARFGPHVGEVHVWTTGDCRKSVNAHLDDWWEALRRDVDEAMLPARGAIELHELPVPDVRDASDAEQVAGLIHDHVRLLTKSEGPVVGWFAGGRKTMSSALQSAMTLYGRPGDELWHVLVHPKIEELPREELAAFRWPTDDWARRVDEPMGRLVSVAKVPFAAVTRFLQPALAGVPWREGWQLVRDLERSGEALHARLVLPHRWHEHGRASLIFLVDGEHLHTVELDAAPARFYARLVRPASVAAEPADKPTENEHQMARRIRGAFGILRFGVAAPFCIENHRGEGYHVPARDRVEVVEQDRPVSD